MAQYMHDEGTDRLLRDVANAPMVYHVALRRDNKRYAVVPADRIDNWRDVFFSAYGREYVHCSEHANYADACIRAAKRAEPYSKTWVSRAIKAAKTFPNEPESEEDASRFLDAFYGNETRKERQAKAKAAKTTPTAEDALRTACHYAKRAISLGMNAELVSDAIGTEAAPDTTAQALATTP